MQALHQELAPRVRGGHPLRRHPPVVARRPEHAGTPGDRRLHSREGLGLAEEALGEELQRLVSLVPAAPQLETQGQQVSGVKSDGRLEQAIETLGREAGADQEDDSQSDLGDHDGAGTARILRPRGLAARRLQGLPQGGPVEPQGRHDAEDESDGECRRQGDEEHAGFQADLREARQAQATRRPETDRPRCQHNPEAAAGEGEQQALGQRLASELAARGPQGGADGDLPPPDLGAHEQQHRQVDAADEQHASGSRRQRFHGLPQVAVEPGAQRHEPQDPVFVGIGVVLLQLLRDPVQLGLGGGEARAVAEPGDPQILPAGTRFEHVTAIERDPHAERQPDLRRSQIAAHVLEAGGHDPHDGIGGIAQQELRADHRAISPEAALPELMAQDDDRVAPGAFVLLGQEGPAQQRLCTQHTEVGGGDEVARRPLRTVSAGENRALAGLESAHLREQPAARHHVLDLGDGHGPVLLGAIGRRRHQQGEPVRFRERQ